MIETSNSEINVEELKARIRASVARREAEGRTSFAKASAELFDLLSQEDFSLDEWLGDSATVPELSDLHLQPVFVPQTDGYHVNDLLKYHDHQFVWNAYLALLKREPDEEGLRRHLQELRGGRVNKIDVLARLRYSPEGKRAGVEIEGLRGQAIVRRAYRVPVVGYLLELAVALVRLPSLLHHQRQAEAHFAAQLDRLADGLNHSNSALAAERRNRAELVESFKRSIAEVASSQKEFARLQHQQLTALLQNKNGRSSAPENGRHVSAIAGVRDTDDLYAAFQKRFRGESADTRENLRAYLPLFDDGQIDSEVLDIGCGNGTWLELLRERGIRARGVESNRKLAAEARAQGLEVFEADAIRYLRTLPEESLHAVTAFHFVEHLKLAALVELISEIHRVLKPGGLLIFETPNPKNLVVGACNFYSDLTHERPLFPESLEFIVAYSGFTNARIEYLHPVADSPFQGADDGDRALNAWFFSGRDYAVIAHKPASA